ncbi:MAG: SpoIIE family protein phosphatase [Bacteroidales bacterium]|nr:SpoIIE family protein phosphatase [Bacteroidales bacterium]
MLLRNEKQSVGLLLLFASLTVFSQDYKVKNYNTQDGICHPFVYTINQDARGYLWLGTGEGLCRFDGFDFTPGAVTDSLANPVAAISYKDADGNLLFGFNDGTLVRYDGREFHIASQDIKMTSSITGIAQTAEGDYLLSTLNNGLIILNKNLSKGRKIEGIQEVMLTALWSDGGKILIGSTDGLTVYDFRTQERTAILNTIVEELALHKIQDIQQSRDKKAFWIATEDGGAYRLTLMEESYSLSPVGTEFNLGAKNFQSVFEDSDNNLWISSLYNGLYKLSGPDQNGKYTLDHLNKSNGLPGNAIKNVFEDLEGNIWIATYGDGLVQMLNQAFSFYTYEIPGIDNDIRSVTSFDGSIWIGGNGTIVRTQPGKKDKPVRYNQRNGLPTDKITALTGHHYNLYIGTESNGLYVMNVQTGICRKIPYSDNSLGNIIQSLALADGTLHIATRDGIYTLDLSSGSIANYSTLTGLPHNDIKHVLPDKENKMLVATRTNGIYAIKSDGEVTLAFPAGKIEQEFNVIVRDASGNLWASTYGDGIYLFTSDTVLNFTTADGLKSNYCYGLIPGDDQTLWIGHRLGISRIHTRHFTVQVYDLTKGITGDCNFNATYQDDKGVIYFGTTEGLITYDPSRDKQSPIPPFTNITRLVISDKEYDFNQDIILPYSLYKLRIEFLGLSYSDPASVKYQYKLEGHDLEWSDITSLNVANYPRIEDGEYTFLLKSFDSKGLSQGKPVSVHIRIKLPFWKTWWFFISCGIALILAMITIIKYRERKQKELQEYLETELAARTKEVVEQKEEIELKNRDITDSITYAQRIQASILPPVKRLQQNFSGSFVFYQPRDIVSGDFYWFDKVDDNKFIIVCADSTGHGVPGAFMSMIGTTLIKDICFREVRKGPSEILKVLDMELGNILNQNLEDGTKPPDGMDIIVCEIDLKTKYMRYAAAMRPLIVYKDSEQLYLKGSHSSVGGVYDKEIKLFQDDGLQLSQGDIVYMFSDGYPDQFGGSMGKKYKMVRLKNMLVDIYQKSMDEQYIHVKNTFNLWKENYEQVDDVLFMGIKI